ncbi:two-component histidine kinase DevS [Mycolicibacterium aurum]|uniref:Two-component histidine kinase DevS n=2 Tax=Mycolicibacterium aurum TaxID=1791 RepID=A0A3S4RY76_MYCAU|nr:two-component histidine kinase DevS [Mycolicibacterium aurum]
MGDPHPNHVKSVMDVRTPRRAFQSIWTAPRSHDAARGSRRRFRTINLTTFLPLLTAVGVFLVARQAQTWQQACVLALGLAAALIAFERWTAGDIARVAVPCLIVSAAVWLFGALTIAEGATQGAYYAIAIVGCLTVSQLNRLRGVAAFGLVAYVAAVGAWGILATGQTGTGALIANVIVPAGFTAMVMGLMFPNKGFYDVVAELEEARDREAELAVIRERMRFASDLHDIQGHTLHVVKLKIALAQKLIHSDTARAEQELREVYELVGDTITHTKALAYGQRKLNLTAELENARNLLEAADIRVRVEQGPEVESCANELLGQVLRETTTNILRHSRARLVRVALTANSITVVNDGVLEHELPELRGLATLADRVSDGGGELTVALGDGRFRTQATFPEQQDAVR